MAHREFIAREGWLFIGFFMLITLSLYWLIGFWFAVPGLLITLFCTFFFRNPERDTPQDKGLVVSPADGRVMGIEKVTSLYETGDNAIRVRIFLSLFNVHINRVPIAGKVEKVERASGSYLPAYKSQAGSNNARNYLFLHTEWGKVLVVQVVGIVARRLICWVRAGEYLQTGERFGLIRFGSCTEVYLPEGADILVEVGQKVRGGETSIARFN